MTPLTETGPKAAQVAADRSWLTPDRLVRVRAILLALTLFFGLIVYVFHSLGPLPSRDSTFVTKLRGVGILTWIYALVQMLDMRFYHSRFARRRRESLAIPESLHGWLFAQMLAWFGILYYALTEDLRWFVGGLVILGVSFWIFPIVGSRDD